MTKLSSLWLNKGMVLTEPDINEIRKIVKEEVSGATSYLPNKDEFYAENDKLMVELKAIRENQEAEVGRRRNIEERVEKLEDIHPKGQHIAT